MSIIAPYTAPEFDKSALITVDVQRDVLEGQPLEVPGSSATADAIGRLAGGFRATGRPIVHIVRLYKRDGSNVDPCRRHLVEGGAAMLAPGSPGSELVAGLLPDPRTRLDSGALVAGTVQEIGADEVVMYKPRWGAFFETPLERAGRDWGCAPEHCRGHPGHPRAHSGDSLAAWFELALLRGAKDRN
jgi:nicotinamidase-related amidase